MRRLVAVLLPVLLLAGCVSVPTSGPVARHTLQQQPANQDVEIAPVPPAAGAAPALIIEGFLHAMVTFQNDYAVARQFLTPAASQEWRPDSGVEIYAEGYPPVVTDNSAVLNAPLVGTLDVNGVFIPPGGLTYHHDFGLVRDEQGQWRISKPPRGLLISQYLFASTYVRVSVYFWDASGSWLVPDARYFAKGQRALSGAVESVFSGPSTWLLPVTRPLNNPGLTVDTVSLADSGIVGVSLHEASLPGAEQRERLLAQLAWTVADLDGVTGVRVRSAGTVWAHGNDGVVTPRDFADAAPTERDPSPLVFALARGGLNRVNDSTSGGELVPVAPALARVNSFAVRHDQGQFAAVTDDRTQLRTATTGEGASRLEFSGAGLLRPQYSRFGELWVGTDRPSTGARVEVLANAHRLQVSLLGLPAGSLKAVRVSPDGVRVAMIIASQGVTHLGIARVGRSEGEVRIDGWRELNSGITLAEPVQLLDVVWSEPSTMLVLANSQQITQVLSMDTDGVSSQDLGPSDIATLTHLAMNPGLTGMAVSAQGTVYRLFGEYSWGPYLTNVQSVNYPD